MKPSGLQNLPHPEHGTARSSGSKHPPHRTPLFPLPWLVMVGGSSPVLGVPLAWVPPFTPAHPTVWLWPNSFLSSACFLTHELLHTSQLSSWDMTLRSKPQTLWLAAPCPSPKKVPLENLPN